MRRASSVASKYSLGLTVLLPCGCPQAGSRGAQSKAMERAQHVLDHDLELVTLSIDDEGHLTADLGEMKIRPASTTSSSSADEREDFSVSGSHVLLKWCSWCKPPIDIVSHIGSET